MPDSCTQRLVLLKSNDYESGVEEVLHDFPPGIKLSAAQLVLRDHLARHPGRLLALEHLLTNPSLASPLWTRYLWAGGTISEDAARADTARSKRSLLPRRPRKGQFRGAARKRK